MAKNDTSKKVPGSARRPVLWVCGMARSGTSWLGKIFDSHPGVLYHCHFYYNKKGKMLESQKQNIDKRVANLWKSRGRRFDREPFFPQPAEPDLMVLKDAHAAWFPELLAKHGRVLFIVRDPRAQINSLKNHAEFGKRYRYKPSARRWVVFNDAACFLHEEDPKKYGLVRFEDIMNEPQGTAHELFKWAGLEWSERTGRFLVKSHRRHDEDPYSVIKNPDLVANEYRFEMPYSAEREVVRIVAGSKAARLYPEISGGKTS